MGEDFPAFVARHISEVVDGEPFYYVVKFRIVANSLPKWKSRDIIICDVLAETMTAVEKTVVLFCRVALMPLS
jgi:hypothetical protein